MEYYDASFADNFYGLKRARHTTATSLKTNNRSSQGTKLTPRDRQYALLSLLVMPYLLSRIDRYYHKLTNPAQEDGFENVHFVGDDAAAMRARLPVGQTFTFKQRCQYYFILLYPYAHAAGYALTFAYQLRFTFDKTQPFFTPTLHYINQRMSRLSGEDMQDHQQRMERRNAGETGSSSATDSMEQYWPGGRSNTVLSRMWQLVKRMSSHAADTAKWSLVMGIFVFKFFEWWYSPSNRLASSGNTTLPIPPPPPPAPPCSRGIACPPNRDPNECLLCHRPRTNPACTTAGYVFCYPCLFQYVSQHQKCPITQTAQKLPQIRKIYQS